MLRNMQKIASNPVVFLVELCKKGNTIMKFM